MRDDEALPERHPLDSLKPEHLHPAQRRIFQCPARVRVAVCGRRFGKTVLGLLEAVEHCQKNKGHLVWWVSASKSQAQRHHRRLKKLLPGGGGKNGSTHRENRIEFENKAELEFLTAGSGDRLRGEGLDFLVVDEAADVPEEVWTSVLRPALVDRLGRALILGTPRGRGNWLHRLWLQGCDETLRDEVRAFSFRTLSNPAIRPGELASARKLMTELEFRQEFEAEFTDGMARVFGDVRALVRAEALERGREDAVYVTGIDLARKHDDTVLASLRVPKRGLAKGVAPEVARMEGFLRLRRRAWDDQLAAIRDHLARFPGPCVVDATGVGDPIFERIARFHPDASSYLFTSERKENLVRGLMLGFDLKRVWLLPEESLLRELESFVCEETAGKRPKYEAAGGGRDDAVMALGLAWWGLCTRYGMPGPNEAPRSKPGVLFAGGFFHR
ncbi:MAG: terminase family protein [Planctomycetota bacterium]|nr:terminase family protein [Planctomycetota bacterium]